MNTTGKILVLTALAGLLVGCSAANLDLATTRQELDGETVLDIPEYPQGLYHNLTWAASTAMIISYCNQDAIDRTLDIARDFTQSDESFDLCPAGSSVPEFVNYVEQHSPCKAREQKSLLRWEELKAEIKKGHPIYARVDYWDPDMVLTGEGFVAVIRGYDEQWFTRILVYYPEIGQERWELWNYFATNRMQVWTGTGLLVDEELPPAEPVVLPPGQ